MRHCPDCQTPMTPTKRTFAEVDVCPKCGGTFLDAGEGVSAFGPDAEVKFLLDDGRARRVGPSVRRCPAEHTANESESVRKAGATMTTFAIRKPDESHVEVDLCELCGGYFFDAGEGEALAAMDAAPPGTFAMPPRTSAQDIAIAEARSKGDSFFGRFIMDFATSSRRKERR